MCRHVPQNHVTPPKTPPNPPQNPPPNPPQKNTATNQHNLTEETKKTFRDVRRSSSISSIANFATFRHSDHNAMVRSTGFFRHYHQLIESKILS